MSPIADSNNKDALCARPAGDGGCLACELRPISMCGALDDVEVRELGALSERNKFAARETIAIQGEPVDAVYNVTSGMFSLYRLLPDGRRQIVGFLLPGDFLGLSLTERAAFCADAVVASTACTFSRASFLKFAASKPHLMQHLHETTAHEMTLAQNHLVLLGRARAEVRMLTFLLNLRERWGRICGKSSVTIPLPMSRADIGDYLGLTIETASRTLNQLARRKLILIVPNGVRLLDLPAIEAIAAGG